MFEHETDRQRRRTETTLLAGGFGVVVVVGGGILWLLYGRTAALIAVSLVLGGALLLIGLWLLLRTLERWAHSE